MRAISRPRQVRVMLMFLSVLTVIAWAAVFALTRPRAAEPVPYSATLYTEAEWLEYARERARFEGLVGDPDSEEWALMSYGSYLTLTNNPYDASPPSRDTPVFIYQMFGSIPVLKWFGEAGGSSNVVGFAYVFDGTTTFIMHSSAYTKKGMKRGGKKLDLSFIPADRGPSVQAVALPTLIRLPDQ